MTALQIGGIVGGVCAGIVVGVVIGVVLLLLYVGFKFWPK